MEDYSLLRVVQLVISSKYLWKLQFNSVANVLRKTNLHWDLQDVSFLLEKTYLSRFLWFLSIDFVGAEWTVRSFVHDFVHVLLYGIILW